MNVGLEKLVFLQPEIWVRDVAQAGSALRSGRRGRKFESCHPDFQKRCEKRLFFLFGLFLIFDFYCLIFNDYLSKPS